jgi:CheY-like chemotaxis protein
MAQTILLIEDDPLSARLADLVLKAEGYEVIIAPNGLQALKIAQDTPPDLIILDLMLPGLDGFEVLNRLRAEPRTVDVPVVVVSSKSQPTDKHTAVKVGANDYLTKPYRKNELVETVRSLLSARSEKATAHSACVILVGARGGEEMPVALGIGLALASKGHTATLVDLHPFSTAHSSLLGVATCPAPPALSDPERLSKLIGQAVRHPAGLCLLNNLEGRGEAGQITPKDAKGVLDALLAGGQFALVDLPLYPIDVLRHAASRCAALLLVTAGDPAALAAARSALTLMERAGVEKEHIRIVFVSPPPEEQAVDLGREVLGTIAATSEPGDPAFHALTDRLLGWAGRSTEGGANAT